MKKWKQQMRAEERKVDRQITSARGAVGSAIEESEIVSGIIACMVVG